MEHKKKRLQNMRRRILWLEVALLFFLFSFSFPFFITSRIDAEVGDNVTVNSEFTVGTSNPTILSISIEGGSITLIPNATRTVNCSVILEDFDGDTDLFNVSAVLFDEAFSSYGNGDDNNDHYTNASCVLDLDYGDIYQAKTNCLFEMEYYANPGTWNCSVSVEDFSAYSDFESNTTTIEQLLAVGLPDTIDYGLINATFVSLEQVANVTNYGNVDLNISLSGYGSSEGDGSAMVCDYGSIGNIPIGFEKYNLTSAFAGELTLSEFEERYTNLTTSPVVREYSLPARTNDVSNDILNQTYWRIYVPAGVAGTCNGTILFGGVQAPGI